MAISKKRIVSFSGGKDSTAMLLKIIEFNIPFDEVIFVDTGIEFPDLYSHIDKVESATGINITRIKPDKSFEYYLFEYERKRLSKYSDKKGLGLPGHKYRWCTQYLKLLPLKRYLKKYPNVIEYVGIAYDESFRIRRNYYIKNKNLVFPLVDLKITENEALSYCYSKGYDWNGLYRIFRRVSCWCCPLQRIGELKSLYIHFPELWKKLRSYEDFSLERGRSIKQGYNLADLEERFKREVFIDNQQIKISY
jgi:3'-phosphoadenosine 5'-phosphosulfate sulfotransferase (PAPS reductase)/FAD synthetase